MRASQWFLTTLRESPADAELISHQYMLRAGLIRKLGSGLYSWLPLGLKVLRKVETIVREEMDKAGAMEILMPAIQPAELWQETDRWATFGGLLLTMKDSNGRDYCFGPTHEEVITDIMRNELRSYKQLPVTFYQIQTKFRDEIRPRFGVMRAREFIMKDAYSFHLTAESLQDTYYKIYNAYCAIFDRLGLTYRAVEADNGAIGGSGSHEFQVLANSGEDTIFYSDTSSYAANIEQATSLAPNAALAVENAAPIETLATPDVKSIDEVAQFLAVEPCQIVKTLMVVGTEQPLVALVLKGDDSLNEVKASKHPAIKAPLQFVEESVIQQLLNAPLGSLGPVNLSIPVIVDHHALALSSFICGANLADKHLKNVNWHRDVAKFEAYDLRNVKENDQSPDGQGVLKQCRGIEVGHVFQLGNKYAEAMKATVLDDHGKSKTMMMGCYGIGVSRIVAAAIEQHHDDKGILWPEALAPFQLVIIPINGHKNSKVAELAEYWYDKLTAQGVDVLLDDRNERPGVLFADSDLIGIPHRLVIGERNLDNQCVEYKGRLQKESELVLLDNLESFLSNLFNSGDY